MPFYDYRCPSCGKRMELMRPISDCQTAVCPSCGAQAVRVYEGKWNTCTSSGGGSCSGNCAGCAGCGRGH
ncbi:MAG: zinc ribbon domain-containing protein [Clostridia bacterium]|nr:zinc ribbon domain-containing protein [Clostridia bacterium]